MAAKEGPPDEIPNDLTTDKGAVEIANGTTTSTNKTVTPLSKEQLDAEFKQTQDAFEIYIKEYKFPEGISKNAKKKQSKKLHLEFFKKIRRKMEREKYKRKRAANPESNPKPRKIAKLCYSANKLRLAIDCSFDDLMSEKDIVKLSKQIQRSYAINRHMENPLQFYLTHIQGKTLARLNGFVDGYKNWDVHIKTKSLVELFKPEDVVYLCAESENLLTDFDDSKVYAIGGFVDHNAHKGVAYKRAVAAGFQHARLPIDSFFTLATRKVLTVCHVFEIISNFAVSKDWENSIKKIIPERKGLEAKEPTCSDKNDNKDKIENLVVVEKRYVDLSNNGNV